MLCHWTILCNRFHQMRHQCSSYPNTLAMSPSYCLVTYSFNAPFVFTALIARAAGHFIDCPSAWPPHGSSLSRFMPSMEDPKGAASPNFARHPSCWCYHAWSYLTHSCHVIGLLTVTVFVSTSWHC